MTAIKRPAWLFAAACCCVTMVSASAWAAPARASAAPARAAAPAAAPETLMNLGDDKLMSELADRGLDNLLDTMFAIKGVPPAQQKGIRSLRALHELSDPAAKMSASERQRRIKQVVEGLSTVLPTLNDPDLLMKYAGILLEQGVTHDVNTLEYWGDNPVTQQRLKPVVQTVMALLDRAAVTAGAQADALANKLKGADDPNAAVWEKMDNLAHGAVYKKNMFAYFLALATDRTTPAGQKERAAITDEALKYLADFDTPDSTVQPTVRVMMGKLNLVKGDYAKAKEIFASIANDTKKEIVPPPDIYQQYDARYFSLVADLESRNIAAARKGLDDLITWQKATLPKDKSVQDGVASAAEMMRYRVFSTEAATASAPDEKKKADDSAVAVLEKLKADRPELAPIIYEQLITRLDPSKPVAELDPLLLQGLMNKGIGERNKPEGQPVDAKIMDRAIAAAKEVLARKDRKGITKELNDDALILIPTLLDREAKPVEAADAYINYAVKSSATNPQQAKDALDRAGFLTFDTKKKNPTANGLGPLYDRFLDTAIKPPFNHKELAYLYAKRLRTQNKPVEAASFFREVPSTDPNYLNAQYFLMLSLKDALDTKLSESDRARTIAEIPAVGENVKKLGAASSDPLDRFKAAHATLIAAELSISEPKAKNPKRALELLADFETQVKALPGEKDLLAEGLFVRVNAYMALGQLQQATDGLVKLVGNTGSQQGLDIVKQLIQQLDKQYAKAELANDRSTMKEISGNEAKLTGFLADWSQNSKDPNIHKYAYAYQVFDANTKRRAGTLEDDPQVRQRDLTAAQKRYNDLLSPASHAAYVATLDAKKIADRSLDATLPDVNVQAGLAFTDFELKDYLHANELLGDILGNHRLGGPTQEIEENGETKIKDNDIYWEATDKWYQSNLQLAKAGGADANKIAEGNRKGLKQMLIRGGIPERYQPDFEAMRKEILPDFDPASLRPAGAVAAGTQPSAAAGGK